MSESRFKDLQVGDRFKFITSAAKRGRPRVFTKVSPQIYASSQGNEARLQQTTLVVRPVAY